MRGTQLIAAATASLLVAGCAGTPSVDNSTALGNSTDCIFGRTISDWSALDDRNLIVFAGRRNPYHVELVRSAFGLSRDFSIGIYDRDGRLCPYGGDAIVVRGGGLPDRVTIASIRQLTEEELELLYVEFGIEEPIIVETTPVDIEEIDAEE